MSCRRALAPFSGGNARSTPKCARGQRTGLRCSPAEVVGKTMRLPPAALNAAINEAMAWGVSSGKSAGTMNAPDAVASTAATPAAIDVPMPSSQRSLWTKRTRWPRSAASTASWSQPVTTKMSPTSAAARAATTRSIRVRPPTSANSLLASPKRREAPAASTTAAMSPSGRTTGGFDDFRQDRHGDLGRTLGANVETYRSMDALQILCAEAGRGQAVQPLGMRRPRAQRADIHAGRAQRCRQCLVVDVRGVGQRYDCRPPVDSQLIEGCLRPSGDRHRGTEPLFAGEHRARIDDGDRVADLTR